MAPRAEKPAKVRARSDVRAKNRPAPRPERLAAYQAGLSAEDRAADVFTAMGFDILARRFRAPGGEIDLIARHDRLLVFVEVKARRGLDAAAWSITPRNRRRIAEAAQIWLAQHPQEGVEDMRFDAVLVAPGRAPVHIAAAFDVET